MRSCFLAKQFTEKMYTTTSTFHNKTERKLFFSKNGRTTFAQETTDYLNSFIYNIDFWKYMFTISCASDLCIKYQVAFFLMPNKLWDVFLQEVQVRKTDVICQRRYLLWFYADVFPQLDCQSFTRKVSESPWNVKVNKLHVDSLFAQSLCQAANA